MIYKRFVFLIVCLSVLSWVVANADAPAVHLVRQDGNDRINCLDIQLGRRLKWSHGAYFFMDRLPELPPVFHSMESNGNWTTTGQFHNSEPAQFYTFQYDRETDATIVFSGQTETAPRVVSPFLAFISADGKIQRFIRTDHCFPYEIAVAPDDTIWTLGIRNGQFGPEGPAVNQEAHVLRHFDKLGDLIGSAFPQSQFKLRQLARLE